MSLSVKGQSLKVTVNHVKITGDHGEIRFLSYRKGKGEKEYVKSYFSFWTVWNDAGKLFDAVESSGTFDDSDRKKGVQILIKDFSLSQEKYKDKDGKEQFSKQPKFIIWDWEFFDKNASNNVNSEKQEDDDDTDSIPF